MSTNILINSRSMNGIITISDGSATLENGDLTCDDINSSTINSGIFTCQGEFRCNLVGLYTIPTLVSSDYGLLISYGNTSGNGATDFTNYQSTYNITKGGFNFWNKSSSQTLTNLAIIDNSQTYFKSQLTGCTAETPLNTTSIVNKTYVDSNFVDRTNNLTQNINGLKTFTNDTNFIGSLLAKTNLKMNSVGFKTGNAITLTFPLEALTILAQTSGSTTTLQLPTITANELGMVFTFFKRGASPFTTTINATNLIFLSNSTSASLTNSTLLDTTKHLTKLLVSQAGANYIWIEVTDYSIFDREQNNLIYARLASPNAFTNTNTFNSFLPTSTLTPSSGTQLITKTYVDSNFVYKTGSVMESITGEKTFSSNVNCSSSLTLLDTGTNSLIQQTSAVLNIENPSLSSSIKLKTRGSTGAVLDSLTLSSSNCEILCQGLLLTASSNIGILSPNNLIGNINLFNTLTTGTIFLGSGTSSNMINGSSTFGNNLTSNGQATFNNYTPFSNVASPSANNHLTRKDYVDNNFLDRTNNLTQNINGLKTFTDDLTAPNIYCNTALYFRDINLGLNKALIFHQADIVYFDTLTVFDNYWKFKCFNIEQVVISQLSSTFNNKLISLAQARFDNFTPACTVSTPTQINHLTRKDYVDTNFLDRTNNLTQNINGLKTFTNDTTFNAQSTFNTICPISNTNATLTNHLTTLGFNNSKYIDFTTDQQVSGTKRFGSIYTTGTDYTNTFGGSGDRLSIYMSATGNILQFAPVTNSNTYRFFSKNALSNQITSLEIDYNTTTINTSLVSNGQATFNNICPISNVNPTAGNHLTRRDYIETNFVDKTSTQTIAGSKIFNGNTTYNGTALYCNCAGEFGNLVHLRNFTRVYDMISPFTGYTQLYTSGNNFFIYPVFANSGIHFYCRTSANFEVQTFISSATANTSLVPFVASSTAIFNSSLISNNLTAPTSTSVNNIYRTLVSGGEINFGSQLSANYIFGQTTFNSASIFNLGCSFLGSLTFNNGGTFSEIEQTSGSNLVIKNTTNSRDIILSTTSASTGQVDSLTINTTSCDILSPTLNLTSSSTINILTPNNLTGVINFLSTLTTATINFCSTAYTSIFNLNARLAHKGVQYMNEVKIISGTSLTLAFPLEQRWQFTSTGATQIVIDLPQLTATSQTGFYFSFYKTASNTNSVKFNRQGTNVIRPLNSITDLTTITVISGTSVTGAFLTAELSSGNFAWIYI